MRHRVFNILGLLILISANKAFANENIFNIRTAPVSALIGITNIELDVVVSEHFTVGPVFAAFDFEHSDVNYDANALGIRVNYHFDKALSGGWLIGVSAMYGDFEITEERDGITYSDTTSTRAYTPC